MKEFLERISFEKDSIDGHRENLFYKESAKKDSELVNIKANSFWTLKNWNGRGEKNSFHNSEIKKGIILFELSAPSEQICIVHDVT